MRRWLMLVALAFPAVARSQLPTVPAEQRPPFPGARVRIEAPGVVAGRRAGTLLRRSGDTLTVSLNGLAPIPVPLASVTSLEWSEGPSRRRGAIRGAIIGAPVGAAMAMLEARFDNRYCPGICDESILKEPGVRPITVGVVAGGLVSGAAFGGLLGLLWPKEVWMRADLAPRVAVGADPRRGMTIGMILVAP
jgi:hypothetical protein